MSLTVAGPCLVTGAAGFVGYHLSELLLQQGARVVGVDSLNDYYDVRLKEARLEQLRSSRHSASFTFVRHDLADREGTATLFAREKPAVVAHLAAQAGVRYSLTHPHAYADANLVAFLNILEGCRQNDVGHLVFASSSSVYGLNSKMPFSVHDNVDHPVSLYAASKKSNELMAHCYSHLYGLPVTGLRFFTVYGPWGRPDMAYFLFTKAILEGRPIEVFNEGQMKRDFTYIDDIAEGVRRGLDCVPEGNPAWSGDAPDPGSSRAPYRIYNIGNNEPVELMTMISTLERALGREAKKVHRPMQPGDVVATWADIDDLERAVGFRPRTSIEDGLHRFVTWYRGVWQPLTA